MPASLAFREAAKQAPARGRLLAARPPRSRAAGLAHARPAAAVPHAGRPHRPAGRRRRHRQCGCHLHRPPPPGDRHLQEPRRHHAHHLRRASAAGAGVLGDRRRHRHGGGAAGPASRSPAAGRCPADQGRAGRDRAQPGDGRGLWLPGGAAVHAVAARARRPGAGRRAVPRRGGAGAPPAGRGRSAVHGAGQRSGARRPRHPDLRGAAPGALLLPRRDRRVRRLLGPRLGRDVAGAARAAPAPARAGAGRPQPRRAGRAHPRRGAVAGRRAVAARHRRPGRSLHCRRTSPAACPSRARATSSSTSSAARARRSRRWFTRGSPPPRCCRPPCCAGAW